MAASGPKRNRNVNKRTHYIVIDQDCLTTSMFIGHLYHCNHFVRQKHKHLTVILLNAY
jgi:hypothetical protein